MKKRKARQAREAAITAEAVTSTAVPAPSPEAEPAPPIAETDDAAEARANDEAEVEDRVEIAELMYQAALARDQVAEAKERAAAELVAAAEARELSFAERAVAIEEMERLVAERLAAADARDQAVAERLAAAEWREQAAAERVAAIEAREKAASRSATRSRTRGTGRRVERDSIANTRDRTAVERESTLIVRLTPRVADGSRADDLDAALERARLEAELQRAHLDALTGAFRREMGRLALRNEIERARRADGKFVIAFIDVDGLKGVNDRDGHAAGDRILRTLAATMRANLRSYDPIVRFGGDEFICGISSIDPGEVQHRIGVIDQSLRNATGVGITAGLAAMTVEREPRRAHGEGGRRPDRGQAEPRLGGRRSLALEGHRSLQGGVPKVLRNLVRAADRARVDPRLGGLLDHAAHEDGEVGRPMEHQDPVVREEHRRDAGLDGRADVGDRLVRAARAVCGDRNARRQAEHRHRLDPAPDRAPRDGKGRGVRRVGVEDTADVRVIDVHGRVHGDDRALDRWQLPFQEGAVEAHADDGRRRVIAQRRGRREVHLLGARQPEAHVAVAVGRDRPAGDDPPGCVDHLGDQVLVHGPSMTHREPLPTRRQDEPRSTSAFSNVHREVMSRRMIPRAVATMRRPASDVGQTSSTTTIVVPSPSASSVTDSIIS